MILDAYALVAALTGEAAAPVVRGALKDVDIVSRTVSTVAAEVVDKVARRVGADAADVALSIVELGIELTPVDAQLGLRAGILRSSAHHRTDSPLSLADYVVAAEALRSGEPLATADPHLLDLVASRGGSFVALPASDGAVYFPDVVNPQ